MGGCCVACCEAQRGLWAGSPPDPSAARDGGCRHNPWPGSPIATCRVAPAAHGPRRAGCPRTRRLAGFGNGCPRATQAAPLCLRTARAGEHLPGADQAGGHRKPQAGGQSPMRVHSRARSEAGGAGGAVNDACSNDACSAAAAVARAAVVPRVPSMEGVASSSGRRCAGRPTQVCREGQRRATASAVSLCLRRESPAMPPP